MAFARALLVFLEVLQHVGQLRFLERPDLKDARHVHPVTIVIPELIVLIVLSVILSIVGIVHVVVLGPNGAVSPVIVEGWVRRRNLDHGPLGQDLDRLAMVREVPRTVGLGHDVILQVPWDLGLFEKVNALRMVGQRVTAGVMLQVGGSCHIRELEQGLVALTVQLERGTVEVILVLELTDVFAKCEMRSLASPVNARQKSILCLSRGISVVLNHCLNVRR